MIELMLIAWMAWFITTDIIYAAKGQMPPRKRVRLAQVKAGAAQQRYGLRGWFTDLLDDALRAETARRRDKAAEQAQQIKAERKAAKARQSVDPGPAGATAVPADHGPGPAAAVPADHGPAPATTGRPAGRRASDPASTVVHRCDGTYCLGCAECRHLRTAWRCNRCGKTSTRRFADEAEASADFARHPCTPDPQGPAPNTGPDPVPAKPAQPAGGTGPAQPQPTAVPAAAGPPVPVVSREEEVTTSRQDSGRLAREGFEMFGRCRHPYDGGPYGMCGEPVCEDPHDGGQPGNPYCRYHTIATGTSSVHGPPVYAVPAGKEAPATSGDDAGDGPLAPVIPMFPNGTPGADTEEEFDMSQPVAEVTGLQSAINYAEGVASAHAAHGAAEGFASSLAAAEYGPGVLGAVAAAQEASTNAGAAWDEAAAKLREALAVKEAYDQNPDAGSKAHVTSE